MDWVKVVKALEDEWWQRSQLGNQGNESARLTGAIAFMLRDCLIVGLSPEDRKRYDDLARS